MPEEHEHSAPGDRLPWGFVLDPAANRRALGDVQERGLLAARDLAERVVSSIGVTDRARNSDPRDSATASGAEPNDAIADLLRAWSEVGAQVLAELMTRTGTRPDQPAPDAQAGRVAVDVSGQGPPTTWRLHVDRQGRLSAASELWLCNSQSHSVGPLRLSIDDLRRSTGALVSSDHLRVDPDSVDLPARCARAVAVAPSVDDPPEPGAYRGVLLADGVPELGVSLELTVENPRL